jgi:hypothetical protein
MGQDAGPTGSAISLILWVVGEIGLLSIGVFPRSLALGRCQLPILPISIPALVVGGNRKSWREPDRLLRSEATVVRIRVPGPARGQTASVKSEPDQNGVTRLLPTDYQPEADQNRQEGQAAVGRCRTKRSARQSGS